LVTLPPSQLVGVFFFFINNAKGFLHFWDRMRSNSFGISVLLMISSFDDGKNMG